LALTWQPRLGQVLADLAVLGLAQDHRAAAPTGWSSRRMAGLNDWVHVEQAIGLVAGTLGIDPWAARLALTRHAEREHLRLRDVARAVTDGTLDPRRLRARP
jgi:hypothetical protein